MGIDFNLGAKTAYLMGSLGVCRPKNRTTTRPLPQRKRGTWTTRRWIPAFAGMTSGSEDCGSEDCGNKWNRHKTGIAAKAGNLDYEAMDCRFCGNDERGRIAATSGTYTRPAYQRKRGTWPLGPKNAYLVDVLEISNT